MRPVELAGALGLTFAGDQALTMGAIFLVGLGWNVAFVASTTLLADSTDAGERARVIGIADAIATSLAAGGSLAATEILAGLGLPTLVTGLAILALVPIPLLALERRRSAARVATTG